MSDPTPEEFASLERHGLAQLVQDLVRNPPKDTIAGHYRVLGFALDVLRAERAASAGARDAGHREGIEAAVKVVERDGLRHWHVKAQEALEDAAEEIRALLPPLPQGEKT